MLFYSGLTIIHPVELAWNDTHYNHRIKLEAVTHEGRTRTINPRSFAPYHLIFSNGYSGLPPLYGKKILRGSSSFKLAKKINNEPKSKKALKKLKNRHGVRIFQTKQGTLLSFIIKRYAENKLNGNSTLYSFLSYVQTPPLFYGFFTEDSAYLSQLKDIKTIRIRFQDGYYFNGKNHLTSDDILKSLNINYES
jgi:hypothetical protein